MASRTHIPAFAEGLPQTKAAIAYAERMHAGQCRSDGAPFILHPLEVAALLNDTGAPDHLIAAGVLHDLLEKTSVTRAGLHKRFGATVTGLVLAVSEDDRIDRYTDRKATLRRQVANAGEEALTLFAADKLSKLRELRRERTAESDAAPEYRRVHLRARRVKHYERCVELLEEHLHDSPLVRELRAEFDALLSDRTVRQALLAVAG